MRFSRLALAAFTYVVAVGCGQQTAGGDDHGAEEGGGLAAAPWVLNASASRIAFVSIKAGEVIETHYFSELSGGVSPTGEARVEVPLDLVETNVEIRNQRMREMFFETQRFPVADIRTTVDPQAFASLSVGERVLEPLTGVVSLHGASADIDVDAFVTRIADKRIAVETAQPIVLYLADFNLEGGLERLREVAGLPSITASSPVTFTFVFDAGPQASASPHESTP